MSDFKNQMEVWAYLLKGNVVTDGVKKYLVGLNGFIVSTIDDFNYVSSYETFCSFYHYEKCLGKPKSIVCPYCRTGHKTFRDAIWCCAGCDEINEAMKEEESHWSK